jgi:hypothetical protein
MNKLAIILVIINFITGCVSTAIKPTAISSNTVLTEEQGVVVVQVINNTERLAPLHKDWSEVIAIRLDNADEKKQAAINKKKSKGKPINEDKVKWEHDFYSLTPSREGVVNSQVFVGAMPEGEYIITTLYSFYSDGNMSSWVSMPVYDSAGKFNVKKKRLTDLGSLIFQPLLSIKEKSFWNSSSSQKAYVTRLEEQQPLAQYVLGNLPQLAQQINIMNPISWQQDEYDAYRVKLGDIARNNAYGNIAISLTKGAKGALASKFGQLKILNHDNSWQQFDLPTNSEMLSTLEIDDHIFIGSEKGSLFFNKFNSSEPWKKSTPIPPKEAIIWMGKGVFQYYAVTQSNLDYKAYSFSHPSQQWEKIGNFKKTNRTWLVQYGGLFPIITSTGGLRIFNDNKIHDFFSENNQWKVRKGSSFRKIAQLDDGTLLGLEVSQWDGIGDQAVSIDNGNTWVAIARSLKIFGDQKTDHSLPAKLNGGQFVSLGRMSHKGKRRSSLNIISNKFEGLDKRKTWKYHFPAQESCETLLPQLSQGKKLYFLCDQGQLVSTEDFGKTWNTEIDVDLSGMQSEYETLNAALKESKSKKESE